MNLTEHFTFEEFTRTTHKDLQDTNREQAKPFITNMALVAAQLEGLRAFIYRPIVVTSGFRCKELNDRVKGSQNSQHLMGNAADFIVKDFDDIVGLNFVFDWCKHNMRFSQLILENPPGSRPWIHLGMPREGREPAAYIFDGTSYKKV